MEKLKEHYYQEYMDALRSKIEKQKQRIKKKEDILTKKINEREEKKVNFIYPGLAENQSIVKSVKLMSKSLLPSLYF